VLGSLLLRYQGREVADGLLIAIGGTLLLLTPVSSPTSSAPSS
jgi:hypothetical protein